MLHTTRFLTAFSVVVCLGLTLSSNGYVVEAKTAAELYKSSPLSTEKDKQLLFGGCDGDPFAYLEKRHRGDRSNSFVTPTSDKSRGLDSALACRLKKLMEFAETKGCQFTINSAMRPSQRCNPAGGACARQGNSCHQYGRAVDLGGSARCLAWLDTVIGRKNANSPFKLHIAYQENGPYKHIQCSEHLSANFSARGGCNTACTGGASINPDTSGIAGPGNTSPFGLGNQFREAMTGQPTGGTGQGGGQQQPLPPQPQQPQLPPQPSPLQPTNYFPTTPTPTQPRGTTSSSTLDTRFDTYEEPPPSVGQKLIDLAYGTEEIATTSHATSVPIYIDGTDVAQLDDENGNETVDGVAPKRFVQIQPPTTFTSDDLGSGSYSSTESGSMLAQALFNIREALLRLLEILRPFGLRNALEGVAEDEFHELHE